jgi:hypothetical protein
MKLRKDWSPRGSYFITVPHEKVLLLGWHEQDQLSVDCVDKKLIVTKVADWSKFTEAKQRRREKRDQVKPPVVAPKAPTAGKDLAANTPDPIGR